MVEIGVERPSGSNNLVVAAILNDGGICRQTGLFDNPCAVGADSFDAEE